MDISVGQSTSRTMTVTAEIVEGYAELTGDHNPLHFDEEFTSKTRFKRLISQGGIAVGLLHALVAMELPGAGTVFTEQHWNFPAPVFIGDTITATGTITEWIPEKNRGVMDFVIVSHDDVEVLTGTAGVYKAVPRD
jgi:3-hydroxybutyryl-CoA dehydratase